MKFQRSVTVLALAVFIPVAAQAGCLKGAVVGGVAGHFAHHHTVLGAIAGCAIAHHMAVKAKEQKAAQTQSTSHAPTPSNTH